MASREFKCVVDQCRVSVVAEIELAAIPGDDNRDTPSHGFRRRVAETFATGWQDDSVGELIKKTHLLGIKFFSHYLNGWRKAATRNPTHQCESNIVIMLERLDHEQDRITA